MNEITLKTRIKGKNPLTREDVDSFALYVNDKQGRHILQSHPSLFILERGKKSIRTAGAYADILKQFFNWMLGEARYSPYFWADCDTTMLKKWQMSRVEKREMEGKHRPADRTIHQQASLVLEFLTWAHNKGVSTAFKPTYKETRAAYLNFRDNDFLAHVSKLSHPKLDRSGIQVKSSKHIKKDHYTLLGTQEIKSFLSCLPDDVYKLLFIMSMSTGLRREELVQIPYIGTGDNFGIKPFSQMEDALAREDKKYFGIRILGKGNKWRTVNISVPDWRVISNGYAQLFYERRKRYRQKTGMELDYAVLWLSKQGKTVTPSMISNAMSYASRKSGIDCSIHQARHWYATTFVIKASGDKLRSRMAYNAAIDESLRKQMGHNDIKTTYQTYINTARFYLNLNGQFFNELYGEEGDNSEIICL